MVDGACQAVFSRTAAPPIVARTAENDMNGTVQRTSAAGGRPAERGAPLVRGRVARVALGPGRPRRPALSPLRRSRFGEATATPSARSPSSRSRGSRPPPACASLLPLVDESLAGVSAVVLDGLGELGLRRGVRGPVPAARPRRPRLGRAGGPHPDPPGDVPAPDRPVPRGLARPLGQQPREPRRRGLAAREPAPGPAPLHHLQPGRRPRHVLPATAPTSGRSSSTRRRTTAAW